MEREALSIVIVAGGSGRRMGGTLPKQYLMLEGRPVIVRTIELLYHYLAKDVSLELIWVRPESDKAYVEELRMNYLSDIGEIKMADGGKVRAESAANGLALATAPYVMVHDGVRPFVSRGTLQRLWHHRTEGAVVPAIQPTDSVRVTSGEARTTFIALPRSEVRLVQTPQLFERTLLVDSYEAYRFSPDPSCTDDASIVERYGRARVTIVEGDERNIKLTTPKDMFLGRWYLSGEGKTQSNDFEWVEAEI